MFATFDVHVNIWCLDLAAVAEITDRFCQARCCRTVASRRHRRTGRAGPRPARCPVAGNRDRWIPGGRGCLAVWRAGGAGRTRGIRRLAATGWSATSGWSAPSTPDGDAISNDYAIVVPFVPFGTYSATLDYIVATR
ncbi:hypothetical protein CC117_02790 [Parafrankia colletiae]|uniref:Uncharacterized protein n=1 Tax=Parafrankia colletiae TaxID=573497 RepID=A0A1S1R1U3_9ACTN|nr:hypothetical protein [Parafrankia colletiae]MCK9899121.1 hypothetical protein [Frankia sp. Cpl3]OHV38684.1 hypothetical protein CC117_02790 [Parafrankia colletiae]